MKSLLPSLAILGFCCTVSAHQPVPQQAMPVTVTAATTPAILHFATPAQEQAFYRYRADKRGDERSGYDTVSRLVSRRTDTTGIGGQAGTFTKFDTSLLSYTGLRGGDDNSPWQAQKYDLDVFQYFDPTADTGINNLEYIQTFDANNNILTNTRMIWSGASWENNTEYIYSYDTGGRLDTVSYYQASPGGFSGVWQSVYQYDASGNLLSETGLVNGGTWIPDNLYTYRYNALNDVISKSWSSWTGSAWQRMTSDTLIYGTNSLIALDYMDTVIGTTAYNYYASRYIYADGTAPLDSVLLQIWHGNSNSYVNVQMNIYTYPPDQIINELDVWDTVNLVFDPVSRVDYFYYHNGLLSSETSQSMQASLWVNSMLDSFRYDANGNTVFYASETWNGADWGSQGDQQFVWSYNNYHQYLTENYSQLDTPAGWTAMSNYYWWYQSYAVPTGISEVPKSFVSDAYPNPFSRTFTVAFDAEAAGMATLKVYDITGRLITRTVAGANAGNNTITWDAGFALPAGMYTYELSLGTAASRGKIVSNE